jgi:hypothetical protein
VLSIEQRVKIVEDRMADHSELFADMRQGLLQFEARVDRRFEQIEARLTGLDQKFESRLTALDQKSGARLTGMDRKMDGGFSALDRKLDTGFRWTSGIMLTGLVANVAAILSQ